MTSEHDGEGTKGISSSHRLSIVSQIGKGQWVIRKWGVKNLYMEVQLGSLFVRTLGKRMEL